MNRNVFIKKKIEEKYNPDVVNNYEELLSERRKSSFINKNTPYKIIIQDKIPQNVNNQNDLIINNEDNDNTKEKLTELLKNRESLDTHNKSLYSTQKFNDNRSNFLNRHNNVNLLSQKSDDFDKLKKDRKSYYQKERKTLDNEKTRYNNILSSLKEKGLIKS
ncbi:hypothetical protein CPAV1605_823 [seawater metagenome]|uniref:Uncharacterized protein n=1 Tax=seawater metagenome TaxID=1561972 RepID=A0A5E8CIA7_9ZZZZ